MLGAAVPEASIDEDRYSSSREDDVRFSYRGLCVDTITQASGPKSGSETLLGICVLRSDTGHLLRAGERQV